MKFRYWAIIYIALSLLLFDPKLFLGGDNARYIICAESLVKYGAMRDLQFPDEPLHETFPPGLPLFLTPFVAVFGRANLIPLKLAIMLCGLGGYAFFEKITKRYLHTPYVAVAMAMYLLTPALINYNHFVLSEVPYMTCAMGAVWFVIKGEKR